MINVSNTSRCDPYLSEDHALIGLCLVSARQHGFEVLHEQSVLE
jgi:hypothetical protein